MCFNNGALPGHSGGKRPRWIGLTGQIAPLFGAEFGRRGGISACTGAAARRLDCLVRGEQRPFRQWGEGAMLDEEQKGSQEKKQEKVALKHDSDGRHSD